MFQACLAIMIEHGHILDFYDILGLGLVSNCMSRYNVEDLTPDCLVRTIFDILLLYSMH